MMLSAFAAFLARSLKPGTVRAYVSALKGIDRTLTVGTARPRLPITMPVLRHLVDMLFRRQMNARDRLMLHAAMLTAFHGCLRCGEFTTLSDSTPFNPQKHLTKGDVAVGHSSASIRLKTSKTDPNGQGVTVHTGAASQPYCAVAALRLHLALTTGSRDTPLFTYQSGPPLSRERDSCKKYEPCLWPQEFRMSTATLGTPSGSAPQQRQQWPALRNG